MTIDGLRIRTQDPLAAATRALGTPEAAQYLPDLERMSRLAPSDFRVWHVIGLLHRQIDQRERAIPALKRARQLSPASGDVAHALARTLFEAGLPSAEAYAGALELLPGNAEVIMGMTSALVAEGQGDHALDGLEQILRRSPLWVEGHALLSDLRWANGEREGFARSFDSAIHQNPAHYELRRAHIQSLLHAEHWERLLEAVEDGRRAIGNHPLFDVNEAVLHSEDGRIEQADKLFESLKDSPDAAVQIRFIRHQLRAGRAEIAAAQLDPWLKHPDARNFWPYASIAWRMTNDPRWQWLEGDDRLVGVHDILDRLPPLDELAAFLRELHKTRDQPLAQSVRGGTQTDGNLFHRIEPVIVALREAIRSAVTEHVNQLPARDPEHPLLSWPRSPVNFAGSWSVWLRSGGNHANHVHPMGWISSALYIALPEDLGKEQAGWLTLGEPQAQLGLDLPYFRVVEPKVGRLALFPSTMWHGTKPFSDGDRITVAFDVALNR